jgi:hypothetical protein
VEKLHGALTDTPPKRRPVVEASVVDGGHTALEKQIFALKPNSVTLFALSFRLL